MSSRRCLPSARRRSARSCSLAPAAPPGPRPGWRPSRTTGGCTCGCPSMRRPPLRWPGSWSRRTPHPVRWANGTGPRRPRPSTTWTLPAYAADRARCPRGVLLRRRHPGQPQGREWGVHARHRGSAPPDRPSTTGRTCRRHGRPPVVVDLIAVDHCWLLTVADTAVTAPPVPVVDRDAADGGLGLYLVARISGARGWTVEATHKVAWAGIDYRRSEAPVEVLAAMPRPQLRTTRRNLSAPPH